MKRSSLRLFGWALPLTAAASSFVLAVFISNTGFGSELILAGRSGDPVENWALALLALAIAMSVFLLRAFDGGGTSVRAVTVLIVSGVAVLLFLFGAYGLAALGAVSVVAAAFVLMGRQDEI